MSHRRTYIEGILRNALKGNPTPASLFDWLEDHALLAGKNIDDALFRPRGLPKPPFGPHLKNLAHCLPLYWLICEALAEEYRDGASIDELRTTHKTSFGTISSALHAVDTDMRPPTGKHPLKG